MNTGSQIFNGASKGIFLFVLMSVSAAYAKNEKRTLLLSGEPVESVLSSSVDQSPSPVAQRPLEERSLRERFRSLSFEQPSRQRYKFTNISPQMISGPQLKFETLNEQGEPVFWVYRHYAEYHLALKSASMFGRYLHVCGDAGLNMSEPYVLKEGQGAIMLLGRTPEGEAVHFSIDLNACMSARWTRTSEDTIETVYVLTAGDRQCNVRRTAELVRLPGVTDPIIRERFILSGVPEGIEIIQFSEYVEADDSTQLGPAPSAPGGLILLCFDQADSKPTLAQIFIGAGWYASKPLASGLDYVKTMRLMTRLLPHPCREGVIAESHYVVDTMVPTTGDWLVLLNDEVRTPAVQE